MGNRIVKACLCNAGAGAGAGDISGSFDNNRISFLSSQYNKTLGNSICYVRPDPSRFAGYVSSDDDITLMTFRSVCGATVSANSSSTPSTSLEDSLRHSTVMDSSASFESSGSFTPTMVPLQLQHRHDPRGFSVGGSMERVLSWSPVMGRYIPSPHDRVLKGYPIEKVSEPVKKQKKSLKQILSRAFFNTLSLGKRFVPKENENANNARVSCSTSSSGELNLHGVESNKCLGGGGELLMGCQNLHWAQGRAGEDRVHVVICEDHGWVFVGIYDGFNGPDATDYLLNNLFYAVNDELKSVLCSTHNSKSMTNTSNMAKFSVLDEKVLLPVKGIGVVDGCCSSGFHEEKVNLDGVSMREEGMNRRNGNKGDGGEKVEIEKRMKVNLSLGEAKSVADFSHSDVLQGLSEALSKTEDAFLKIVDEMITHNAELAMMGSCVLVMLLKGEDVYLMNVGDSRAVLATQTGDSLQLTMEHSTHIKEEVYRIRKEHPDDPSAVTKGRVKGYLSVTRAFGVGFLKRPKQNNALLESFKVSYKGESPYITCDPSLNHHKLSPNDKFLILSSDGLYQYFTNEEAVTIVESFITLFPDKDPAQFLIEEALSRAAKKAGIEFHELLDIPHGERRLYHDDISIVIISLEGKIWRSLA